MQRDIPETQTPAGRLQPPPWVARAIRTIEGDERLDVLAEQIAPAADALASGPNGPALRGEWLGHALHPLLTDFPLGCWLSAGLLDVIGGRAARRPAQRLIGIGLLTVPVTAAAGLVDWQTIRDPRARRVGVVHAVGNTVVVVCYFRSWQSRRSGHHARGRLWALAGGALAWGTGYLGGHLSFGRGIGDGLRGLARTQTDEGADARDALVDFDQAAAMLGVLPEQVTAMIDEELLMPVAGDAGAPRLRASEVRAVRLTGG